MFLIGLFKNAVWSRVYFLFGHLLQNIVDVSKKRQLEHGWHTKISFGQRGKLLRPDEIVGCQREFQNTTILRKVTSFSS